MAKKLFSDAEIMRLRKLFQEFDADNNGSINLEEANSAIKKFGLNLSLAKVAELIAKVDTNKSNTIEFVEFMKFATFAKETVNAEAEVKSRELKLGAPTGSGSESNTIQIQIIQARGLPKADIVSKIDPFFVIKYGGVVKKTQVVKSSYTPVYNETFVFPQNASDEIEVELWDYDSVTKNDLQGALKLNINQTGKKWYPITSVSSSKKGAGEVEIEIVGSAVTGAEPAVKSRSFDPAPSPSSSAAQEVALPVVLLPNNDARGNVNQYGTLPITLRNILPLGPVCVPYSFVIDQELSGGIFKILLISQLNESAWGRWAGLVTSANLGLKEYHIVGNNAVDHDLCQISILGVKSNGNWRYRKPEYVEPAGRVELALEYQATGGLLRASWNGQTLPFGVKNIPQAVRFTFELPNSLELTIVSLVKLGSPTISTQTGHIDYDW